MEQRSGTIDERSTLGEVPLIIGHRLARSAFLLAGVLTLEAAFGMTSEAALAQHDSARVRVDAVKTEPLDRTVPVIGRLVARQAGVVSARINGPVDRFQVEVGDRVDAGDVIAVLTKDSLEARRDLAASQLAEAEAQIKTKEASLALARQEARRLEGLKDSAAFNQSRYEDVQQEVAVARAEVAEAEANAQTYSAEMRLAEINLSHAQVVAPYAGAIAQRRTEAGAYLQVGDPVVDMIADGSLEIEADVPFRNIIGLAPGTAVSIALDDGTKHWAIVRAVVPEENPLTRTRTVRFVPEFGETLGPLAADQSVTVQIPTGAPRTVVSVHKDAVIKRGDQSIVYVVAKGSAQLRTVHLGEAVGSRLEVLDGLNAGDLVVVRGNERLQPGDKVSIDKES